jgi:ribose/xylose/arabinose/galactoside ABC-type transport system permease subunit
MTFAILTGGIDLSLGSTVALTGVIAAILTQVEVGIHPLVAIATGIAIGSIVGVTNGLGVVYGNLAPFIMTLGTMQMVRGVAFMIVSGRPIFGLTKEFQNIARGDMLGIPNLIFWFFGILLLSWFLLTYTSFGRHVYAIGGNEMAATVSGVRVERTKVLVYMISSICAGTAGVLLASRVTAGIPSAGIGYELDAIAASVIGGVSMTGGIGKIYKVFAGALLLGLISNGLDILNVSTYIQQVLKGAIILFAVIVDMKSRGLQSRTV